MSLKVWLPFTDNDLANKGSANLHFNNTSSSVIKINNNGKLGKCWERVDTSGNYIYSTEKINLTRTQSMFCWINFTNLSSLYSLTGICGTHRYSTCTGMGITIRYVSSTSGYISCDTGTGSSRTYVDYYGKTLLQAGNWYHVGFTYDGTNIRFYVNGSLDGTTYYPNQKVVEDNVLIYNWAFGGNGTGIASYTNKYKINDLRMYDHCLSENEIKELSRGLVAQYKFNDINLESTTNLCPKMTYDEKSKGTWGWTTSEAHHIDISNEPVPNDIGTKLITVHDPTKPWGGTSVYAGSCKIKPNTKYFYSMYAKATDNFSYVNANFLYSYQYDSSGKYITEFGIANSSNKIYVGNGWYRFFGSFTSNSAAASINLHFFTYPQHNVDYILTAPQLEEKDHLTPYIFGSRIPTILPDNSGNGYDGIIHGTLKPLSGSPRASSSIFLNGHQNPYLEFRKFLDNSSLKDCTITYWMNWTKPTSLLFTGQSTYEYYLMAGSSSSNFWHTTNTVGNNVEIFRDGVKGTYKPTTDGWHFFTLRHVDLSKWTVAYINNHDTTWHNTGSISDLRIYSTALSDEDIKEIYSSPIFINKNKTIMIDGEFNEVDSETKFNKNGNIECKEINELGNDCSINKNGSIYCKEFIEK